MIVDCQSLLSQLPRLLLGQFFCTYDSSRKDCREEDCAEKAGYLGRGEQEMSEMPAFLLQPENYEEKPERPWGLAGRRENDAPWESRRDSAVNRTDGSLVRMLKTASLTKTRIVT